MMNGGNILVLQRVLGHTDIKMTMRYAHFAPDHLEDAVKLNPLAVSGDKVAVEMANIGKLWQILANYVMFKTQTIDFRLFL
jgi:hypothetical protein